MPVAAVGVRQPDVRESVVEGVAGANAAVPALRCRLPVPAAVTARQVDRGTDGLAVEPDLPPAFPARCLEHLEGMPLAGLDGGIELDVLRLRARDRDLVVDAA